MGMQHPSGLKSCPKCLIVAHKVGSNVVFDYKENIALRSMSHYRTFLKVMEEQHLAEYNGIYGMPPLAMIETYDPIRSTTIDYMHAVDLGVVARLASLWLKSSSHQFDFYIDPRARIMLNETMNRIRSPSNLPRSIRGFQDIASFKATEWNTFLLYVFPVV